MSSDAIQHNIIEIFKKRRSVRTYKNQDLSQEQKEIIQKIINDANSLQTPFNSQGVEVSTTDPGLSRFGVISNESGWIAEKIPIINNRENEGLTREKIIDASFIAHYVLMQLIPYDINTIWIAGSFNEGEAEKRFKGYKVPAVIAYGIEETKPHFMAKMIKTFGLKSTRIPFEQLFYDDDNKKTISENDFDPSNQNNYKPYLKDFLLSLQGHLQ